MTETPLHLFARTMGWVAGLILGMSGGCRLVQERNDRLLGRTLVSVLAADEDLAAGRVLTYETLAARSLIERYHTDSMAQSDDIAYLVGRPLKVPLKRGDLLRWTDVDDTRGDPPRERTVHEQLHFFKEWWEGL